MPVERRFSAGYREAISDDPGLVLEDDGDVVLISPDGTRTTLGGGGTAHAEHENFAHPQVLVENGNQRKLPWTHSAGATLLEATGDGTQPVVLEAGLYAFMADVSLNDAMTIGGYYHATLTASGPDEPGQVIGVSPVSSAAEQYPQIATLVLIRYLTPAENVELVVHNHDGVNDLNFEQLGTIVQRIS